MKISAFAVAAAALPLASGQPQVPLGMRGAAAGEQLGRNAEEKKKTVDSLPIKEAIVAMQSKSGVDSSESSAAVTVSAENAAKSDQAATGFISDAYKYESSKWEARGIKADVSLDVGAFEEAVSNWSKAICDLGITATLFDKDSNMVSQKSFGYGPMVEGWTGDTVFTPYSNTKAVAAATYLASVVDTGLGYLDEPISTTFTNLVGSQVGKVTPRQVLSHTSGLQDFNREDPVNDPYYSCKYDQSKTLRECVETVLLTDDTLANPPGYILKYNNAAFDVLAVVAVEKTGMKSWGRIFKTYIAQPLGMKDTSYKCPILKSTNKKPGVAWGLCSTGHDFPKFVQMLSNDGMSPSGEQVLTNNSVLQMFTQGTGTALNAGDYMFGGPFVQMTRCFPRMVKGALKSLDPALADVTFPLSSIAGYGLGTMFFLGNQGEIKGHAGSTGGVWLVAPGRFSVYLTWMCSGSSAPEICTVAYSYIADILNALESSSTFALKNAIGEEDGYQTIDMCGGYIDLFSELGIESVAQNPLQPAPKCSDVEQGRAAEEVHPLVGATNLAGQIL